MGTLVAGIPTTAIGSHVFAGLNNNGTTDRDIGYTVDGSNLKPSNVANDPSGTLSGTWRLQGRVKGGNAIADGETTLWKRIS